MPKPVKKSVRKPVAKPKRSRATDPKIQADRLMLQHMQAHIDPMVEPVDFQGQLSAYMSRLGAVGGKISGAKRKKMPKKVLVAVARKGAAARWRKKRSA